MVKQKSDINPKTCPRLRLYWFIAFVFTLLFTTTDDAFADNTNEYVVKAAFTLNFAKYTKWPHGSFADASSPCLLYIEGDRAVESVFQSVSGSKIGTRRLKVEFAEKSQNLDNCHMIFISRTVKTSEVLQILEAVKGKPVLTISETEEFIGQGGMINFFTKNGRLYFEINLAIVRQQNIWLSSQLLKLAVLTGKNSKPEF